MTGRNSPEGPWTKVGVIGTILGVIVGIISVIVAVKTLSPQNRENTNPSTAQSSIAPPSSTAKTGIAAVPRSPQRQTRLIDSYSLSTTAGQAVDLDANEQFPWTAVDVGPLQADIRLAGGSFGLIMANNRGHKLFIIPEGSPAACEAAIATGTTGEESIKPSRQLVKGSTLCVETDHERLAVMTVTRPTTDYSIADGIEFKVALYEIS